MVFSRPIRVIFLLCAMGFTPYQAQPRRVRVAFLAPAGNDAFTESAIRGARLGSEEARQTAGLMGLSYTLDVVRVSQGEIARRAADSAQILISALPPGTLEALLAATHNRQLVIDIMPTEARVPCSATLVHLAAPSTSLTKNTMWNSALQRFGGEQLNDRYTRATGAPMDDAAWLGWFASKVAVESAMRAGAPSGDSIVAYARSRRARYDGQKGRSLSFDPATGFMAQPLYVKTSESAAAEPAESKDEIVPPACRARAP